MNHPLVVLDPRNEERSKNRGLLFDQTCHLTVGKGLNDGLLYRSIPVLNNKEVAGVAKRVEVVSFCGRETVEEKSAIGGVHISFPTSSPSSVPLCSEDHLPPPLPIPSPFVWPAN